MTIVDIIEKLTDNYISILVITSGVYFVFAGVEVPEWFILGFGSVLAFYYKKVIGE